MPLQPERLLLYLDAAEPELVSARYAIGIAKMFKAKLHAVYVINESMLEKLRHAMVFLPEEEHEMARDLEQDGRHYLEYVQNLARERTVEMTTELLRGIPHRLVTEKAAELKIDLIVVGELEAPRSRRDFFHDEAHMILWTAKCPVLVVRDPKMAERMFEGL